MPSLDSRITSWMRDHHATISSHALVAAGISIPQRDRLVAAGVIERVVDGAYRFVGARDDELARCAALCTSRPHLVVAGPTAGASGSSAAAPATASSTSSRRRRASRVVNRGCGRTERR